MNLNRLTVIGLAVVLLAGILGCSAAIDRVIDDQVSKAIENEKKKLPLDLEHGIRMTDIQYQSAENLLTLVYVVEDRIVLDQYFDEVESSAHDRVRNNAALQRALDNGIRVFHEFQPLNAGEGGVKRVETK